MNGEADNSRFVSMHVYMHLAFKENSIEANDYIKLFSTYIQILNLSRPSVIINTRLRIFDLNNYFN